MGRLEHPDDAISKNFGVLGQNPAAKLGTEDNSNLKILDTIKEPEARNEAGWDDEKESKMKDVIYSVYGRIHLSLSGYNRLILIWYREGKPVSKEKFRPQRG